MAIDMKGSADESAAFHVVAGLTHDLKTPLNAMLSLVGVLLREIDGPLTSEQRTQVDGIRRNGEHLLELINQLLEKSSLVLRGVTPSVERVDVAALAREIIAIHKPLADELGITLTADLSGLNELFATDRKFVRQIVSNLVGNALKFTPAGGAVSVSGGVRQQSGGVFLWLDVVDTGAGIRWSQQGPVLEALTQGDAAEGVRAPDRLDLKGVGLGLSLVRAAVRALGGELEIKSELNQGTLFSVSLPSLESSISSLKLCLLEDLAVSTVLEKLASDLGFSKGENLPQSQLAILSLDTYDALPSTLRDEITERIAKKTFQLFLTYNGSTSERTHVKSIRGAIGIAKPFDLEEVRRLLLESRTKLLEAPAN